MATLLVTGAGGFIGKNLICHLSQTPHEVISLDKAHTEEELLEGIQRADFIIHLAGVNRPTSTESFQEGNVDFTAHLLSLLESSNKNIPLIVTSSTQALLDNPYGKSKKEVEDKVLDWAKRTGGKAFIYRLTNVFGKWCLPHYNSAVATFCYNLTHHLPITIHDPNHTLHLVYIDDVISSFMTTLENVTSLNTGIYEAMPTYPITLGSLENLLISFQQTLSSLMIPDFTEPFTKKLYATFISYLDTATLNTPLINHSDSRGNLCELIQSKPSGQIFISTTKPGITRGNHYHHTKFEKFFVLKGQATIQLRHHLSTDTLTYQVSGSTIQAIIIPPGYTHNITNTGEEDLLTLFWSDEIFDVQHPDTYYEEV